MDLSAVVVDDERLARDELCFLLGRIAGVEVIGQAGNGLDALRLVDDLTPDVLLLDVQMPGLSGFEVARQVLRRQPPTQVVFVTAYDQHAIEAFEINAVDYLLKPVEPARLEQALARVERRIASDRAASLANQDLERIVQLIAERQNRREQLAIRVGERFLLVQADEIIYASLADEVISVVTGSVSGVSSYRTLDELQARLDPNMFWRVHRSHLVNIHKIKEIVPWFSRNFLLRMKDPKATEIPVSRSQTKRLREYLSL
jgi:DNA-binding LytR/AlgR family response regulator